MKTKTTCHLIATLVGTVSLFAARTTAFSQTPLSSSNTPAAATTATPISTPVTPPVMPTMQSHPLSRFSQLTPAEHDELMKAHQQALQDPAVQSTRQIARMTLHKAMLRIDPSIETILANMDAHGPKDAVAINTEEKSLGGHFDKWSNNIPPSSRAVLTPEDKMKLRAAHDQALKDPAVIEARKTARVTLYNAMINADPLLPPILAKAGIKAPSNVETSMKNSAVGSEEKILGGNGSKWDKEVLSPAVKKQEQVDAAATNNSLTNTAAPAASPTMAK